MKVLGAAIFITAALATAHGQSGVTMILLNGKIWTENPAQKEAEAVAISGSRIAAVGTNA